jgi:hypothetical protein
VTRDREATLVTAAGPSPPAGFGLCCPPMQQVVSAHAYAKHRGVSAKAVTKAIKDGRLQRSVEKRGPGWAINPIEADQEWAESTDSGSGYPGHAVQMALVEPPEPVAAPEVTALSRPISYAEARAQHERFKARLAELELEQREGKLVEAEAAKKEAFRIARLVRDAMLNIPDRVAAELAAEGNQFKVHQRLTQEIRRALEDMKLE